MSERNNWRIFCSKLFDWLLFPKIQTCCRSWWISSCWERLVKENKRQTEIAEYLNCKFITIDPDKKDFSTYDELGEIYRFFDKFKKRQIKNLEKENEKLRKENEEFKKEKKKKRKRKQNKKTRRWNKKIKTLN